MLEYIFCNLYTYVTIYHSDFPRAVRSTAITVS
jgi:hypothetical protein